MLRSAVLYPADDVLTLPQSADVLNVTPMTLRIWLLEGRIPARQIGRMIYLRRDDLEAYKAVRAAAKHSEGAAMTR